MELVYTSSSHAIAQPFSSPVLSDNIARNGRDSINETKYLCIFGGGENDNFPFLSFPFYSIVESTTPSRPNEFCIEFCSFNSFFILPRVTRFPRLQLQFPPRVYIYNHASNGHLPLSPIPAAKLCPFNWQQGLIVTGNIIQFPFSLPAASSSSTRPYPPPPP